jgi:hypothetical protein
MDVISPVAGFHSVSQACDPPRKLSRSIRGQLKTDSCGLMLLPLLNAKRDARLPRLLTLSRCS